MLCSIITLKELKELMKLGADMKHVDINGCNFSKLLTVSKEKDKMHAVTRAATHGRIDDICFCIEFKVDLNKPDQRKS